MNKNKITATESELSEDEILKKLEIILEDNRIYDKKSNVKQDDNIFEKYTKIEKSNNTDLGIERIPYVINKIKGKNILNINEKYSSDIMNGWLFPLKKYLGFKTRKEVIDFFSKYDFNKHISISEYLKNNSKCKYPNDDKLSELIIAFLNVVYTNGNMCLYLNEYYKSFQHGGNGYDGWDNKLLKFKNKVKDEKLFNKLINDNYLQDYVRNNKIITIRNSELSENNTLFSVFYNNAEDFEKYLENVITLIIKRSIRIEFDYSGTFSKEDSYYKLFVRAYHSLLNH